MAGALLACTATASKQRRHVWTGVYCKLWLQAGLSRDGCPAAAWYRLCEFWYGRCGVGKHLHLVRQYWGRRLSCFPVLMQQQDVGSHAAAGPPVDIRVVCGRIPHAPGPGRHRHARGARPGGDGCVCTPQAATSLCWLPVGMCSGCERVLAMGSLYTERSGRWCGVGGPAAGSGGCLLMQCSAVQLRPALRQRACQLCTMVLVVVYPGRLAAESA